MEGRGPSASQHCSLLHVLEAPLVAETPRGKAGRGEPWAHPGGAVAPTLAPTDVSQGQVPSVTWTADLTRFPGSHSAQSAI